MVELLVVMVTMLLAICVSTLLGPRIGLAAPLLLVAIGVLASLLPAFSGVTIEPEWILEGLLPPLLYSSAVSIPSMNFRRELTAISGLSVVLVLATSLILGLFFMIVIPQVGFAWGVALGAIVSPTDAVATSIVKQAPVSKRAIAILDGESLLNDATALVVLRTAIVATAATFSFWGAVGTFAYSVVVAVLIGIVVGIANLAVRKRLTDSTVNTVISFTVPFIAAVPAELLSASGLVAAVCAGLVTGYRAPRELSPQHRLSDSQNWRTVELVLEGIVFLTMGLQIKGVVTKVQEEHSGIVLAVLIAVAALLITLLVRAAYVAPWLGILRRKQRRYEAMQPKFSGFQEKLSTPDGRQEALERIQSRRDGKPGRRKRRSSRADRVEKHAERDLQHAERDLDRFAVRIRRGLADIDYFLREPMGWREGTIVVWAGMRGAVTVAAAQTLPIDTPHRAELVLIAYTIAALSLLLQGGTIGRLARRISPPIDQAEVDDYEQSERKRLLEMMRDSGQDIPEPTLPEDASHRERFEASRVHRLAVLDAQRDALLDAREDGVFDADILSRELRDLDAAQLAIELRGT
ncbi:cation:proton antiporter [Gordonia sp. (in: high G+C Gram-positive bacteria)]|uniref:cation:proton antiporter n=1 Tax=Gordonia sp. (in: high G+C Gram-positive bacteria) TaxID=84139 RepID=UPI0039E44061